MVVGRANGAKGYNTSLYSTNPTATLTVVNNRAGGAPALDLEVKGGPALGVNTSARIDRLNADYVDGYQADTLTRVGWCGTSTETNGDYHCTIHLNLTRPGFVALAGSVDAWRGSGIEGDAIRCLFYWKPPGEAWQAMDWTEHEIILDSGDGSRQNDCATVSGIRLDQAGDHRIRFSIESVHSSTTLGSRYATVVYSPFNSEGDTPSGDGDIPES
jgi:hypothetical protein